MYSSTGAFFYTKDISGANRMELIETRNLSDGNYLIALIIDGSKIAMDFFILNNYIGRGIKLPLLKCINQPSQIAADLNNPETQEKYGFSFATPIRYQNIVYLNYSKFPKNSRVKDIDDANDEAWKSMNINSGDVLIFGKFKQIKGVYLYQLNMKTMTSKKYLKYFLQGRTSFPNFQFVTLLFALVFFLVSCGTSSKMNDIEKLYLHTVESCGISISGANARLKDDILSIHLEVNDDSLYNGNHVKMINYLAMCSLEYPLKDSMFVSVKNTNTGIEYVSGFAPEEKESVYSNAQKDTRVMKIASYMATKLNSREYDILDYLFDLLPKQNSISLQVDIGSAIDKLIRIKNEKLNVSGNTIDVFEPVLYYLVYDVQKESGKEFNIKVSSKMNDVWRIIFDEQINNTIFFNLEPEAVFYWK